MHLSILGDGALVAPLTAVQSARATPCYQIRADATAATPYGLSDLLVLVASRIAIADMLDRVGVAVRDDVVIIDATTLDTLKEQRAIAERALSDGESTTLLPGSCIVRAFASVPTEAFAAIVARQAPRDRSDLAVPLAGDDVDAMGKVCGFMQQIGVEPFDLGPSARVGHHHQTVGEQPAVRRRDRHRHGQAFTVEVLAKSPTQSGTPHHVVGARSGDLVEEANRSCDRTLWKDIRVSGLNGLREAITGRLTPMARVGADAVVLVMRRVTVTFRAAHATRFGARGDLRAQQIDVPLSLSRHDLSGGLTDDGAIQAQRDAPDQLRHLGLGKRVVGARRAGLRTLDARLDALDHQGFVRLLDRLARVEVQHPPYELLDALRRGHGRRSGNEDVRRVSISRLQIQCDQCARGARHEPAAFDLQEGDIMWSVRAACRNLTRTTETASSSSWMARKRSVPRGRAHARPSPPSVHLMTVLID
jgi:predicted dinucleotide-binding enzyme